MSVNGVKGMGCGAAVRRVLSAAAVAVAMTACSAEMPKESVEAPADDAAVEREASEAATAERAQRAEADRKAKLREAAEQERRERARQLAAAEEAARKAREASNGGTRSLRPTSGAAPDDRVTEAPSRRSDRPENGETFGRGGGEAPGRRTRGLVPAPSVDEPEEDWTLVPVFYGTDRERKDTEERIAYSWKRGRRLELGQAMVSVPKNHVEPRVERPWSLSIPFTNIKIYEAAEDPAEHFTVQEIAALSEEEFLALVRARLEKSARFKDHALVFIHGYQTTFDNAVYRTAQIAFDLKFDGAPFLYSWPSGGTLQGYTYDRESAAQAERYLRKFFDMVTKKTGAKKVSVIAHSMGNQLLLRVLQDMKRSLPEGLVLSQLILAAPDVDRDSFENIVSSITGIAEGITLYAAANDQALLFSKRVNGGVPRAGDVPGGVPLIIPGVDSIDATATSMDSLGINHAGYAENLKLLGDIGKLIETGVRPPQARVPDLEVVDVERGTFWRYPSSQ